MTDPVAPVSRRERRTARRRRTRTVVLGAGAVATAGLLTAAWLVWPGASTGSDLATSGTPAGPGARSGALTAAAGSVDAVAGLPPAPASPGTASTVPPVEIDNRVFVLGDSVLQGTVPYLAEPLEGWSLLVDTRVGRFMDDGARVAERRRPDMGQVVVVDLGNNYDGDEVGFRRDLDRLMDALSGVRHVILLTVTAYRPDRAEVNAALRDAAAQRPGVTLVDAGAFLDAGRTRLLGGDRLHLSDNGAMALAQLVGLAVNRVTAAAGERPRPGPAKPQLRTSGVIPGR